MKHYRIQTRVDHRLEYVWFDCWADGRPYADDIMCPLSVNGDVGVKRTIMWNIVSLLSSLPVLKVPVVIIVVLLRHFFCLKELSLKGTYCTTRCECDKPLKDILKMCRFWHHRWACPPRCMTDTPTCDVKSGTFSKRLVTANHTHPWRYMSP